MNDIDCLLYKNRIYFEKDKLIEFFRKVNTQNIYRNLIDDSIIEYLENIVNNVQPEYKNLY